MPYLQVIMKYGSLVIKKNGDWSVPVKLLSIEVTPSLVEV